MKPAAGFRASGLLFSAARPPARLTAAGLVAVLALAGADAPPILGQVPQSPHGPVRNVACESCHTDEGWTPAKSSMEFDHARATAFPLSGRHADTPCGTCHLGLRFDQPAAAECSTCHVDVHRGSLGADCTACHDTETFARAPTAEAHLRTSFPLTGAHLQLSCESCHLDDRAGGEFAPLDTGCMSCHEADYRGARLVDHVASGFPTECLQCHTVVAWRQAPLFDHSTASSGFELLGAHAQTSCEGCHLRPGNELRFTSAGQGDCIGCHRSDYDRKHGGSSIPTDCIRCHNVSEWDDATFDHDETDFPLVARHASLGCESCHRQPGNELVFPRPTAAEDCVACHRPDYDREHAGSGLPTTCLGCHTQDSWEGADFDHAQTGFALVGAHQPAACESCHRQPGNQLLFPAPSSQDDCVACHQTDYNAEHGGTGYPTTCLTCHDTTQFQGAVFDHDAQFFPIHSGKHQGEWNSNCAMCHTSAPADYTSFTCLSCHEHNQKDMDDKHKNEPGYAYVSSACLGCHPQGRK